MSEGQLQFAPDAEARVNDFLAAVERALAAAGCSQPERQNVADDLRAQITEMVTARLAAGSQQVSRADVEAVLAELDPPEAFASAAQERVCESTADDEERRGSHAGRCGPRGRRGWWHKWRSRADIHAAVRNALSMGNPFAAPPLSAFDERSRRAVAHAKNEARKWQHNYIGTEHVLIGIAMEEGGLGAIILKSLGLDAPRLREEVGKRVKQGPEPVTADLLPITPRSQRSFRHAAEAARSLGSDLVGTEHLLLGLIAVPDGLAARVLIESGASLDRIKAELLKAAGMRRAGSAPPPRFTFWPAGTAKVVSLGGETYKLIATGEETGAASAIIELHCPAGAKGLPPRSVLRSDVAVYVLEGSLRVTAGNRTIDVASGGFVNIPRGTLHSIRNAGASQATAILVATPAGLEAMLADAGSPVSQAGAPAQSADDELQHLLSVAPKYGVEFKVPD